MQKAHRLWLKGILLFAPDSLFDAPDNNRANRQQKNTHPGADRKVQLPRPNAGHVRTPGVQAVGGAVLVAVAVVVVAAHRKPTAAIRAVHAPGQLHHAPRRFILLSSLYILFINQ